MGAQTRPSAPISPAPGKSESENAENKKDMDVKLKTSNGKVPELTAADSVMKATANKKQAVPELLDESSLPTPIKTSLPTPIPAKNWQFEETVKKLEEKIKETEKPKEPIKKKVPEYKDIKNFNLFCCSPCGSKTPMASAENFKIHINSADHKKSMEELQSLHENTLTQLRTYAQFLEIRKTVGKTVVKISQRCELCQMSVYGNMARHRTSKLHLKLKKFVHPMCEICDVSFKQRIDWDNHKLSAAHLFALDKDGENNIDEKEYYEGNFADKVLDLIKNNDGTSAEAAKEDDPLKEEKTTEAAQLTLAKVLLYHIPDFEDSEIVGSSFLQPIQGSFCKACKKLVLQRDYESHCKSKEHYDKFVNIVNGKKSKAFQMESKISKEKEDQENNAATKRKNGDDDEEEDEEDDSGNWKRQRKTEYPVAYDF